MSDGAGAGAVPRHHPRGLCLFHRHGGTPTQLEAGYATQEFVIQNVIQPDVNDTFHVSLNNERHFVACRGSLCGSWN